MQRIRRRDDVQAELADVEREIEAESGGSLADLLAPAIRLPLIIGVGLAILQQVTGVNTVIYYAPAIFKAAGLGSATASIAATTGLGVVNVLMTVAAIWLLDRVGRKPLLMLSVAGMTVALILVEGSHAQAHSHRAPIAGDLSAARRAKAARRSPRAARGPSLRAG